jgi:putative spermidine/putrescine transport system ATP-binding protein
VADPRNGRVVLRLTGVRHGPGGPDAAADDVGLDLGEEDLRVAAGELVAVCDPVGAGARSVLHVVAGLTRPHTGRVLLGGRDVTEVPAPERPVALVAAVTGPGPRGAVGAVAATRRSVRRSADPAAYRRRADELLRLVGLADRTGERVRRLPAPDRQRLALVPALAGAPDVLLLDEPLSAFGGRERLRLREDLRRLQLRLGVATLLATSEPADALAVADRVAVLRAGRLLQVGTPDQLYDHPATAFVAAHVGGMNRIPAVLGDGDVEFLGVRREVLGEPPPAGPAFALVRPEALHVRPDPRGSGRVVTRTFGGAVSRLAVALPDGLEVQADVPSADSRDLTAGTAVTVTPTEEPALVEPVARG